jgi:chromosome segregation ATPase
MNDRKRIPERLQAIVTECERAAQEAQALIDRTRALSEIDAGLARALSELDADLNGAHRTGEAARDEAEKTLPEIVKFEMTRAHPPGRE